MSDREKAIHMVENIPENKLVFVLAYLQGLTDGGDEEPNDETEKAFGETDQKIKDGTLKAFDGSTEDFLKNILEG